MKNIHISKSRFLALVMVLSLFTASAMPLTVNAATKYYPYTITRSSGFSKKWDVPTTVYIKAEGLKFPVSLTYGYDTWCTKEDYVTKVGKMPTGCKCKGTVMNSKGTPSSTKTVNAGKISGKADVKHTGKATYQVTMWFG